MQSLTFALNKRVPDMVLDTIEVDPSGLIRIVGWSSVPFHSKSVPDVRLDTESVPFLQHYRTTRRDVESQIRVSVPRAGLVIEYLVPEQLTARAFQSISVCYPNSKELRFKAALSFLVPHYRNVFDTTEVLHREQIYGVGPPGRVADPNSIELTKALPGPVLDFGCGSGALVAELHALGTPAHGLELERPPIVESIPTALRPSITLYDGNFPSPFETGAFASVFCSEVLEHIPDFEAGVREITRLARQEVIITVPDAGAIPLGFRHAVVPWHLLEASHFNFFNQSSLAALLQPHFAKVEFSRMCPCRINDTVFHVNLVAMCWK